ncbi:vacuolar iron transporter homolog 4-like [Punica granatum]|uniref:Vacuolar iron transporter n=1 Tax=Punica granatum TaxID=22663 RepID=A0A6P8E020_PUNGR|nr:vacuolar iron transporter homolog 4-like [Punica granatum]
MEEIDKQQNTRSEALQRAQWLRAAILGANDGLLSTTSLMLGVGAAREDRQSMVLSGLAGALAGALSMAVGEFVSVSTQRDIEECWDEPALSGAYRKRCLMYPDSMEVLMKERKWL